VEEIEGLRKTPQKHRNCETVELWSGVCRCLIWRGFETSQFHSFTAFFAGGMGGRGVGPRYGPGTEGLSHPNDMDPSLGTPAGTKGLGTEGLGTKGLGTKGLGTEGLGAKGLMWCVTE